MGLVEKRDGNIIIRLTNDIRLVFGGKQIVAEEWIVMRGTTRERWLSTDEYQEFLRERGADTERLRQAGYNTTKITTIQDKVRNGLILKELTPPTSNARDPSVVARPARRTISKEVQREVWRRDEGRCVECGSKELLEFDHIIPLSKGGSNTTRNIQLLCEKCNRSKAANIGA